MVGLCKLSLFFLFFFQLWTQKERGNFDSGNLVGGVLVQKGEVFLESWIKREFERLHCMFVVWWWYNSLTPVSKLLTLKKEIGSRRTTDPIFQAGSRWTVGNHTKSIFAQHHDFTWTNNKQSYNHKRNNRTTTMVCPHDLVYVKQLSPNCTHSNTMSFRHLPFQHPIIIQKSHKHSLSFVESGKYSSFIIYVLHRHHDHEFIIGLGIFLHDIILYICDRSSTNIYLAHTLIQQQYNNNTTT